MAETTVAADAVPPVAVSDADAAPSVPPAAFPANRRRPRVAAKRSHLGGGTFPSVALAVVSGLLGVVLGYALGLRRGKKRGEAEETAPAEPNPPRALALTPPASPGPTLASPARAKRAPPRRAVGAETNVLAERTNVANANVDTTPAKRLNEMDTQNAWTLSDFLAFADVKLGKVGGQVARWSVEGDVFEYPTGRRLARVAGVDVCRRVDDANALSDVVFDDSSVFKTASKTVSQMSRKLLLFLDPETEQVMTQFEGRTVSPAAFPYQITRYAFFDEKNADVERDATENDDDAPRSATQGGGSVTATVTVGAGVSKMTLTGASVAVSRGRCDSNDDQSRVFSVPAFLDVETEDGGRHEAYESYDYFFGASEEDRTEGRFLEDDTRDPKNNTQPVPVFAWTRFGACAPFGEACVLRALARRVATHDALPASVREYVEKHAPEYADAPRDAAEIIELQR